MSRLRKIIRKKLLGKQAEYYNAAATSYDYKLAHYINEIESRVYGHNNIPLDQIIKAYQVERKLTGQ